jgi:hypothetical protein
MVILKVPFLHVRHTHLCVGVCYTLDGLSVVCKALIISSSVLIARFFQKDFDVMRWLRPPRFYSPRNKCLLLTHSWHKKCCTCVYRAQVNVLWLHFRFPILLFFDFFLRERGVKTKGKKDDVMICWELARACFSRILIRLARAWHNLSLFLWPIWIPCVKKTRFLFLYSPCRIIGTVRLCGVRKKNPKFFVYVYSLKQKKKRS